MGDCACSSTAIYPREIETELGGREREKEGGGKNSYGRVCVFTQHSTPERDKGGGREEGTRVHLCVCVTNLIIGASPLLPK